MKNVYVVEKGHEIREKKGDSEIRSDRVLVSVSLSLSLLTLYFVFLYSSIIIITDNQDPFSLDGSYQ